MTTNNEAVNQTAKALVENLEQCQALTVIIQRLRNDQPKLQRAVALVTVQMEDVNDEEAFEQYDVAAAEGFMAYQSALERLLEAQMHLNRMHDAFSHALSQHYSAFKQAAE